MSVGIHTALSLGYRGVTIPDRRQSVHAGVLPGKLRHTGVTDLESDPARGLSLG